MIAAIATLSLAFFSTPQEPEEVAPGQDVIVLDIGTEIAGRIVRETADYVEIELAPGTVVGFPKSRTRSIVRAQAPHPADGAQAIATEAETHRDEWSMLHDASGRVVGWLHATVTRGEQGEIRIGEEWRLRDATGTTELTFLEVLTADGAPTSCFYHERMRRDGDDRVREERLVRAVIEDGKLKVRRRSTNDSDQQEYELPPELRFPLELQAELRRRPAGSQGVETHVVFDPREARFLQRRFDFGRIRRIAGDDGPTRVRVVTEASGHGENSEWIDGAARVVRREINGPALVAVPTTESEARRSLQRGDVRFPSAFRAESGGRFGMWLPHSGWCFDTGSAEGTLSAHADLDDAAVSIVRLDHLGRDVLLPSAADALGRWLVLVQPGLRIVERESTQVRSTEAVCFRGTYEVVTDGRARPFVLLAQLFADADGTWHAVCGCAPKENWPQVEPDLQWIVERVEWRREGFAPELRGPVAERSR